MSRLRSRGSRVRLAATAIALALSGIVVTAAPASAHAELVTATPQQSSQVSAAPTSVSLTFSEGVGLSSQSVKVLDSRSRRVDTGDPRHPVGQPSTVTVDLKAGLPNASYVVVWRVASSDSHPIAGTFSFGIGVPAGAAPATLGGSPLVVGLDGVFRGIAYLGAVLLLGGVAFVVWLWPAGMALARPRRLVTAGWLASAVGAVGLFLVQGSYGAGLGVGDLLDPMLLGDTLGTRYGQLMVFRLAVLAVAISALRSIVNTSEEDLRPLRWNIAGFGAAFLGTFSLSEHAGQGDLVPVWAGLDALHLAAACVWVGGLAMLAYALLRRSSAADLAAVLPRWSRLAMVAVATLVVTGTAQAWHEIGSLPALIGTEYGLLVLGKVAGLIILLVLADKGRRWVNRNARAVEPAALASAATGQDSTARSASAGTRSGGTHTASAVGVRSAQGQSVPPSIERLRASVTAEVGIAAVVLALTAVLVNTAPAILAYPAPYSATVVGKGNNGQDLTVLLDVDRTQTGPTTVRIYTYSKAGPVAFVAVDGSLTEPSKGLGPVNFVFSGDGKGRGTASVVVPAAGTWTLTTQIRTDQTTDYSATTTYSVRGP